MQSEEVQASEPSHAAAHPIDRSKPASIIAEKFGGLGELAKALGKNPSTCHRWLVSGLIPAKHQAAVLAAASAKKIKLRPADFIDMADAA